MKVANQNFLIIALGLITVLHADSTFAADFACGVTVADHSIEVKGESSFTLPPLTVKASDRKRILELFRGGANAECATNVPGSACAEAMAAASAEGANLLESNSSGPNMSASSCDQKCPNFYFFGQSNEKVDVDSNCTAKAAAGDFLGDVDVGMSSVTFKGIKCTAEATGAAKLRWAYECSSECSDAVCEQPTQQW